jgi:hypothetical protein
MTRTPPAASVTRPSTADLPSAAGAAAGLVIFSLR